MARTGRRPGQTETRAHILAAARAQFGAHGYAGATIRGIAAGANVNPALVHHFFGTKDQVFVAALNLPVNPAVMVETIVDGPRGEVGERLLRLFLAMWRTPEPRQAFLALIRSVASTEQAAALLRQFLEQAVLSRIAGALGVPELRAAGLAAQLVGLAMVRYVVGLEPLASASDEELVALVAPVLQQYIDGTGGH